MNQPTYAIKSDTAYNGWLSVTRLRKRWLLWNKPVSFRQYYGVLVQDNQMLLLYQDNKMKKLVDSIDLARYELTTGSQFCRKSQRSFHLSTDSENIVVVAESRQIMQEWVNAIRTLPTCPSHSVIDKWLELFDVQPAMESHSSVDLTLTPSTSESSANTCLYTKHQPIIVNSNDALSLPGRMQSLSISDQKSSIHSATTLCPSHPPASPRLVHQNILEPSAYNSM